MTADTREQSKAHSEEACREIEQLETELAAVTAERDEWKRRHDNAVTMLHDSEEEKAALKRGEYVCKKCGIRKDGEGEKGNF
jgi:hypothetical protein